jgi:hypothetical protein
MKLLIDSELVDELAIVSSHHSDHLTNQLRNLPEALFPDLEGVERFAIIHGKKNDWMAKDDAGGFVRYSDLTNLVVDFQPDDLAKALMLEFMPTEDWDTGTESQKESVRIVVDRILNRLKGKK